MCAGIAASATYNVWRGRGDEPVKPGDFLPEERPSEEEIERQAEEFFRSLARQSELEQARKLQNKIA